VAAEFGRGRHRVDLVAPLDEASLGLLIARGRRHRLQFGPALLAKRLGRQLAGHRLHLEQMVADHRDVLRAGLSATGTLGGGLEQRFGVGDGFIGVGPSGAGEEAGRQHEQAATDQTARWTHRSVSPAKR
jgi:hypothetical protein